MPGCLGLDAMWQLAGFYLPWLGEPGRGRALGVGEVKFTGQVLPDAKLVRYEIDIKPRACAASCAGDRRRPHLRRRPRDLRRRRPARGPVHIDGGLLNASRRRHRHGHRLAASATTARRVSASLRDGRAGIRAVPEYAELGLRSQVAGVPRHRPRRADRPQAQALHGRRGRLRATSRCAMRSPMPA